MSLVEIKDAYALYKVRNILSHNENMVKEDTVVDDMMIDKEDNLDYLDPFFNMINFIFWLEYINIFFIRYINLCNLYINLDYFYFYI